MVTIKDVAKVAKVSTSTVSRVVRGRGKVGAKCRARVQKIIDEMGYRPNINARALVSRKSEMIGIVSPNFSSPFFGTLAAGAGDAAKVANYKVMMSNSDNQATAAQESIDSLREYGCENIIMHNNFSSDEQLLQWANEIPGLVIVSRLVDGMANRCVWLDNASGGRMAAEYLIQRGHSKIAIIASDRNTTEPLDRVLGAKQAAARHNLVIPDENIFTATPTVLGGAKGARYLLENNCDFSCVLVYNDTMAVGAMNTFQDMQKKVPEDISVIGFDDVLIASTCRPYLTTMRYPIYEMGAYATKLSIQLTSQDANLEDRTHLFMPSLVERNSVFKK